MRCSTLHFEDMRSLTFTNCANDICNSEFLAPRSTPSHLSPAEVWACHTEPGILGFFCGANMWRRWAHPTTNLVLEPKLHYQLGVPGRHRTHTHTQNPSSIPAGSCTKQTPSQKEWTCLLTFNRGFQACAITILPMDPQEPPTSWPIAALVSITDKLSNHFDPPSG